MAQFWSYSLLLSECLLLQNMSDMCMVNDSHDFRFLETYSLFHRGGVYCYIICFHVWDLLCKSQIFAKCLTLPLYYSATFCFIGIWFVSLLCDHFLYMLVLYQCMMCIIIHNILQMFRHINLSWPQMIMTLQQYANFKTVNHD
jgi:hypothetical protein